VGCIISVLADQCRVNQWHVRTAFEPHHKTVQRNAPPRQDKLAGFVSVNKLNYETFQRPLRDRLSEIVPEVPQIGGDTHTPGARTR
jgi:hypothetical protein